MNNEGEVNIRMDLSNVGVSKSEDKMNTGIVLSNVGINKSEDRMNIGVDVSSVGVSKSEDKINIKIEDKVNIGIESNNTELNSNKNERGACWEHNFNVEFPIIYRNVKNGVVSVDVDSPHAGYMIRGKLLNGVLNGKCVLLNGNCNVIGIFNFVDGIVSGVCRINDENGVLYFEGNMKNGYREGYGIEYDLNGNVMYEGLYKQGKRMNIVEMKEMKGYWKELNDANELLSICHKNKKYENDGICYFYSNGAISKESEYKNGEEVNVLKRFEGNKMIEYKNGMMIYKGGYLNTIESDYARHGMGEEYGRNGDIVYEGEYDNGKRPSNMKLCCMRSCECSGSCCECSGSCCKSFFVWVFNVFYFIWVISGIALIIVTASSNNDLMFAVFCMLAVGAMVTNFPFIFACCVGGDSDSSDCLKLPAIPFIIFFIIANIAVIVV